MLIRFLLILILFLSLPVFATSAEKENVIVLHGIARSADSMEPVVKALEKAGYAVTNVDYPSTDYTIQNITDNVIVHAVARCCSDPSTPLHFVTYSMGGLVALDYIHRYRPENLGRVVMMAPPLKGSEVADFLKNNLLYEKIYGPAGQQLTTEAPLAEEVDFELGVIAGTGTIDPISSLIIPGEDDGKVAVERTKIRGMKDHITVDASHTFFMYDEDAQRQAIYFLQHGKFDRAE